MAKFASGVATATLIPAAHLDARLPVPEGSKWHRVEIEDTAPCNMGYQEIIPRRFTPEEWERIDRILASYHRL